MIHGAIFMLLVCKLNQVDCLLAQQCQRAISMDQAKAQGPQVVVVPPCVGDMGFLWGRKVAQCCQ